MFGYNFKPDPTKKVPTPRIVKVVGDNFLFRPSPTNIVPTPVRIRLTSVVESTDLLVELISNPVNNSALNFI